LVTAANGDLMTSAASIKADETQFPSRVSKIIDGVLASRNRMLEGQSDAAQLAMQNAHTPSKIMNVKNVFLMRLWSEDDKRAPRTMTFADPTVGKKDILLLEDDLRLMRALARLTATDWLGSAGVDGKFESEDCLAHTSFVKDIPTLLNHHFNFASDEINMGANANVFHEFGSVASTVPEVDVGASRFESCWKATCRFSTLSENEQVVVDVVTMIEWNARIDGLGPPNLGRDFDRKRAAQSSRV
jgi:hypothetical protein